MRDFFFNFFVLPCRFRLSGLWGVGYVPCILGIRAAEPSCRFVTHGGHPAMLFDNAALVHAERRVDALVFIRWDAIANVSPTNIAMLTNICWAAYRARENLGPLREV